MVVLVYFFLGGLTFLALGWLQDPVHTSRVHPPEVSRPAWRRPMLSSAQSHNEPCHCRHGLRSSPGAVEVLSTSMWPRRANQRESLSFRSYSCARIHEGYLQEMWFSQAILTSHEAWPQRVCHCWLGFDFLSLFLPLNLMFISWLLFISVDYMVVYDFLDSRALRVEAYLWPRWNSVFSLVVWDRSGVYFVIRFDSICNIVFDFDSVWEYLIFV